MKRYIILLLLLLSHVVAAYSQERRTAFRVDFRVGSSVVEPGFSENAQSVEQIVDFLDSLKQDSSVKIVSVWFCGTASPEGIAELNRKLSQKRLASLEQIVCSRIDIPESLISRQDNYFPWADLKTWVKNSDIQQRETVLAIIDDVPDTPRNTDETVVNEQIQKLRQLDNGRIWQQLVRHPFAKMRFASVVIVTLREEPEPEPEPVAVPKPESEPVIAPEPKPEPMPEPESVDVVEQVEKDIVHHVHLKTNALGWGMLMVNLAGEVDICDHLSFALPVYYSGADYFKSTLKFHIFGFYPELRYWLQPSNDGWFAGAHFGLAWYNFAFNGEYRYQDHARCTPAMGGGISVGYRMPISKNERWKVEFALGVGVYGLHYDLFYNVPNGKLASSARKTYIGFDQASISFAYTFDLNKRRGRR